MNGTCNIFIYKNCEILKEKNFKVDYIQDYLDTLETLNPVDAETEQPIAILGQWMKHSLKLKYTLKIPVSGVVNNQSRGLGQYYLSFDEALNYNYLVAQNVDTFLVGASPRLRYCAKAYYFIVGKKWLSENSIELELEMDVINTLIDNNMTGPNYLRLSSKTLILREHKDRWKMYAGLIYLPVIDPYSEGIIAPLFKKEEQTYYDAVSSGTGDPTSWYLVYRSETTDQDSPIRIHCCTDDLLHIYSTLIKYNGEKDPKAELKASLLKAMWLIYGDIGASISFTDRNGSHTLTITSSEQMILICKKSIAFGYVSGNDFTATQVYEPKAFHNFRSVIFRNITQVRYSAVNDNFRVGVSYPYGATFFAGCSIDDTFPTTAIDVSICSINDINRTDPKLLKIIKLPYAPFNYHLDDNGNFVLPKGWGIQEEETEGGEITFPTILVYEYGSSVEAFTSSFTPQTTDNSLKSIFDVYAGREINDFGDPTATRKGEFMETKLLHSDFYLQKLVYDSFHFDFNAELYEPYEIKMHAENILYFYITATMTSKMMFRIGDLESLKYYRSEVGDVQDYSNLLYVARNNELPVFNSAYLNYIRTGYNYDIKTKNRQLASTIIGGVLSTAGAVVSAVSSPATGPVGIAGAIGLGIGAVQKFASATFQSVQADQNIAQKLRSTELQGLSIIGSDDVDLMSIYTNENKMKYVKYEASSKVRKSLYDLFHYCGYIANYQGTPNVSTRKWFNFVQAEALFVHEQNFPQEYIDALKTKYREGITFLHRVLINGVAHYDFAQQMENWETKQFIKINTGAITTLELNKEYVINPDMSGDPTTPTEVAVYPIEGAGMTLRFRRKSDMSLYSILFRNAIGFYFKKDPSIFGQGSDDAFLGYIRNGANHDDWTRSGYNKMDYYITIEFTGSITRVDDVMKSKILGYVEDPSNT